MKRLALVASGLTVLRLLLAPASAPVHAQASAADESAVRDVVKQYVSARERRDSAAIGALFTPDADQLTSSGEWRRGSDQIVQGTLASSQRTGGTRTIAIGTVRFPGESFAIADGRYEISGTAGGGARMMWTTFVLTRSAGVWRISAIRNMLPAAPIAGADRRP